MLRRPCSTQAAEQGRVLEAHSDWFLRVGHCVLLSLIKVGIMTHLFAEAGYLDEKTLSRATESSGTSNSKISDQSSRTDTELLPNQSSLPESRFDHNQSLETGM